MSLYYQGIPVEELNREELIKALEDAYTGLKRMRDIVVEATTLTQHLSP